MRGTVKRSSGPAPPSLLHYGPRLLRVLPDQLFELAAFEHLHHDVRPADELALDVQLGHRRPVAVMLDALADLGVLEHVDRLVGHAKMVEDRHRPARKTALRE